MLNRVKQAIKLNLYESLEEVLALEIFKYSFFSVFLSLILRIHGTVNGIFIH